MASNSLVKGQPQPSLSPTNAADARLKPLLAPSGRGEGSRQSQGGSSQVRSSQQSSSKEPTLRAIQVRIESAIFESSDFKYYIVVHVDDGNGSHLHEGKKRRTDLSGKSASPLFNVNKMNLSLQGHDTLDKVYLYFQAYAVKEWKENTPTLGVRTREEKSVIGECKFSLEEYEHQLRQFCLDEKPLFFSQKFVKPQPFSQLGDGENKRYGSLSEAEHTVGRFNFSLYLAMSDMIPLSQKLEPYADETLLQTAQQEEEGEPVIFQSQQLNYIPLEDPNYEWRVRVDIRAGVDMPLNHSKPSKLPSVYFQIAWSEGIFFETVVNETIVNSMVVEESRHPNWNQQLLIHNPHFEPNAKGFLWVSMLDKGNTLLDRFFVPLAFFENFKPIHLELLSAEGSAGRSRFYLSLCLEKQLESFFDSICSVAVNWAEFDPLPFSSSYFNCILTTDNQNPCQIYRQVDLSDEQALSRAFRKVNEGQGSVFVSPVIKLPPEPIRNLYGSLVYFKIPKSFLDRKLKMHILANTESTVTRHAMPSVIVGSTDLLDQVFKTIIQSTAHGKQVFPVRLDEKSSLYRQFSSTRVHLHMTCYPTEGLDEYVDAAYGLDKKALKAVQRNTKPGGTYDVFDERDRWQLLSKELQLKQEVLHRTIKDIKDKSDELKTKGKEIIQLRKDIKALQLENNRLSHAHQTEDAIERECELYRNRNTDKEPVQQLPVNELKNKLLKLAQAYKADKVRNVEFEKQVRLAYKDIELLPKIQRELEVLQIEHRSKQQKLLDVQEETAKESKYQAAIRKQEIMIAKLENLLERCVMSKERVREGKQEMESLQKEIQFLQGEVRATSFGSGSSQSLSEVERLRKETGNLKGLLMELQQELNERQRLMGENGMQPVDRASRMTEEGVGDFEDWEDEKASLEIEIQRASVRAEALQSDIDRNEQKYTQEVLSLERQLAEKNRLLEGMSMKSHDRIQF